MIIILNYEIIKRHLSLKIILFNIFSTREKTFYLINIFSNFQGNPYIAFCYNLVVQFHLINLQPQLRCTILYMAK